MRPGHKGPPHSSPRCTKRYPRCGTPRIQLVPTSPALHFWHLWMAPIYAAIQNSRQLRRLSPQISVLLSRWGWSLQPWTPTSPAAPPQISLETRTWQRARQRQPSTLCLFSKSKTPRVRETSQGCPVTFLTDSRGRRAWSSMAATVQQQKKTCVLHVLLASPPVADGEDNECWSVFVRAIKK